MPYSPLLFGKTVAMAKVVDQCLRYGRTRYPVLILGPPGTGKTVLARHIHGLSGRPGEIVTCSLGSMPPNLETSTLRGHVRGAFTDASADRPGLVEEAHQGTLFLDELGLASAPSQETLLEVLDESSVRRIGESRRRPVDVRIVAALAKHYVAEAARSIDLDRPPTVSDRVAECLLVAPWEENIRELRSVCVYAVLHSREEGEIRLSHLPTEFVARLGTPIRVEAERTPMQLAHEALEQAGGNKTWAARLLGVSRRHFYRLLAE